MGAWLLDSSGQWHEVVSDIDIQVVNIITRLQTIKGEQSFNATNGIDFLNIINGLSLLEIDVDNIARDFTNYFDVTMKNLEADKKNKVIKIDINLKLKNSFNNDKCLAYTALIGA